MLDDQLNAAAQSSSLYSRCNQFAQDLLQLYPGLDTVTVLPSWTDPSKAETVIVSIGRQGPLTMPQELMHSGMTLQLALARNAQLQMELFARLDAHAQQLAEVLKHAPPVIPPST